MKFWKVTDINERIQKLKEIIQRLETKNMNVNEINGEVKEIIKVSSQNNDDKFCFNQVGLWKHCRKTFLFDITKYLVDKKSIFEIYFVYSFEDRINDNKSEAFYDLKFKSFDDILVFLNGITIKDSQENEFFLHKVENKVRKLYTLVENKDYLIKQLKKDVKKMEDDKAKIGNEVYTVELME